MLRTCCGFTITLESQLTACPNQYALEVFENIRVLIVHQMRESATGVIARFCGSLPALLRLAECSLRRRRVLPESRENAHSHPSN